MDVNYTGDGNGPLIDLDMEEVENYGTDSEVEQFLQNNEETQGYEERRRPTGVDVFRIFANGHILREREMEKTRNFSQLNEKLAGTFKGRNGFPKMQENVGNRRKKETFWRKTSALSENGRVAIRRRFRAKKIGAE